VFAVSKSHMSTFGFSSSQELPWVIRYAEQHL